jgi:hypothetical protein
MKATDREHCRKTWIVLRSSSKRPDGSGASAAGIWARAHGVANASAVHNKAAARHGLRCSMGSSVRKPPATERRDDCWHPDAPRQAGSKSVGSAPRAA